MIKNTISPERVAHKCRTKLWTTSLLLVKPAANCPNTVKPLQTTEKKYSRTQCDTLWLCKITNTQFCEVWPRDTTFRDTCETGAVVSKLCTSVRVINPAPPPNFFRVQSLNLNPDKKRNLHACSFLSRTPAKAENLQE